MRFKEFINEAKVSKKSIGKSTELIARYFNTHSGNSFREFGRYSVSKYGKSGVIQNVYVDSKNGAAIGINWLDDGQFLGISMWDKFDGITSTPDREIELENADSVDEESFAKYLPRVVRMAYGESDIDLDEGFLQEAAPQFSYNGQTFRGLMPFIQALYDGGASLYDALDTIRDAYGNGSKEKFVRTAYGLLDDGASDLKAGDVYAAMNGDTNKTSAAPVKILRGRPQQEEESDLDAAPVKEFMKTKIADPAVVYKHLEAYAKSVADGTTTALLVTGKGGTGKSFTIDKVLNARADGEWFKMKGKASAKGMYLYLYNHYDKIVVFDDCDSVFSNADGINILKGALDTSDHRVIGWLNNDAACINTDGMSHEEIELALAEYAEDHAGKQGFPSEFVFEGQVIFISNLTLEQIRKKDSALLTRCQVIDVTLDAKGLISRMETILPSLRYYKARCVDGQKVELTNEQDKEEVMAYLKTPEAQQRLEAKGEEFSIRTLIKACKLKQSCPDLWKDLI